MFNVVAVDEAAVTSSTLASSTFSFAFVFIDFFMGLVGDTTAPGLPPLTRCWCSGCRRAGLEYEEGEYDFVAGGSVGAGTLGSLGPLTRAAETKGGFEGDTGGAAARARAAAAAALPAARDAAPSLTAIDASVAEEDSESLGTVVASIASTAAAAAAADASAIASIDCAPV